MTEQPRTLLETVDTLKITAKALHQRVKDAMPESCWDDFVDDPLDKLWFKVEGFALGMVNGFDEIQASLGVADEPQPAPVGAIESEPVDDIVSEPANVIESAQNVGNHSDEN